MNQFEKILLTIFFIELFVGGGGRLLELGPLSIRQVLFLLLLVTFVYRIIKEKAFFNKEINTFFKINLVTVGVYLLIGWFIISALIGYLNGHALSIIVTDLFRVAFFAVYFPLAYYISEKRFAKEKIITILKYSALIVAIFTIVVSLLGKTIYSGNFKPFYDFMNFIMKDDLFFRPSNSVFYKSHFFVLMGLIISLNDLLSKKYTKLDIAVLLFGSVSVIWSETRGFILAFIMSVLMIIVLDAKLIVDPIKGLMQKGRKLFESKLFVKKSAILLVVIIALPFLYQNMTLQRFEQDTSFNSQQEDSNEEAEVNDESVNARMEFILDSKDILLSSPTKLIFGSGYGTEIAGRTTGIEMSFLDILVEQGVIGLAIWGFLFLLVFYNYYIAYKKGAKVSTLEISFMAAFMGLLLLTNINPFINNPLGITFFIILLVASLHKKESTQQI